MGKTRALGGLLSVASVLVIIAHLWFGYIEMSGGGIAIRPKVAWSFGLPVTVGVLVVCALGLWLGWIMATTKEVSPPPMEPQPEKAPAEGKKK